MFEWLNKNRKKAVPPGLVGIEAGTEGIALAQVLRATDGAATLQRCLFRPATRAEQAMQLAAMADEFALAGAAVNLVLSPPDYQLLLLDCPDVAPDELRDAMRWRVRDLISEPLEEVVVDAFLLPADAYRGRSRMAYCAVLAKARMRELERMVEEAGLRLASIDIGEMAFRNLGVQAGAEELNLAVLRLGEQDGLITIQRGADLYMARRIEQGLRQSQDDYGTVTLEIQRSLDYFESQLGKGYLNRLLLGPTRAGGDEALIALGAGLSVNLQSLDLTALFPGEVASALSEADQAACFAAVGAALRQEAG